ncbi:MAG: hypothetical protein IPO94_01565 [Saprospiraceae bacterium]|nr:hypothetical protein [Saprospiraceae bacterium]
MTVSNDVVITGDDDFSPRFQWKIKPSITIFILIYTKITQKPTQKHENHFSVFKILG